MAGTNKNPKVFISSKQLPYLEELITQNNLAGLTQAVHAAINIAQGAYVGNRGIDPLKL